MPDSVDRCVSSLLEKWKDDPSSRPTPKKEGQDEKSQAFAICQAVNKKAELEAQDAMLSDGHGPALLGVAATNRPFIPALKPIQVITEGEGDEKNSRFVCHLASPGFFNHPRGRFVLNRQVFAAMIANFTSGVIGQDVALDTRHRPDRGSLAWFDKLYIKDGKFYGDARPTPRGSDLIGGEEFRYCSMEFHRNFKRDDVRLDLEEATQDFCLGEEELAEGIVHAEDQTPADQNDPPPEENDMGDNDVITAELEQQLEKMKARAAEADKRAQEAEEAAITLQRSATETRIGSVIGLAKVYRDKDGNGHPAPLIEWAEKILRLKGVGEGDGVIELSSEASVPQEVQEYIISAVEYLLTTLPGTVPLERQSKGGKGGAGGEDKFDYEAEWD